MIEKYWEQFGEFFRGCGARCESRVFGYYEHKCIWEFWCNTEENIPIPGKNSWKDMSEPSRNCIKNLFLDAIFNKKIRVENDMITKY